MKADHQLPRLLTRPERALLALNDGRIFRGFVAGKWEKALGEVVFNTSMTGYEEILSDPSYAGQIVCLTTAHVGQVGINGIDSQSASKGPAALIVQDLEQGFSSWRGKEDLLSRLEEKRIPVGWGFDVRAIVHAIRESGALPGALVASADEVLAREAASEASGTEGKDLASSLGKGTDTSWDIQVPDPFSHAVEISAPELEIAVLDLGIKASILRELKARGCALRVFPATAAAADILNAKPAGVLFSNGPGDPAAVVRARETARKLIGKLPVLGICLGHQILGLALGARTVKLIFGHHGGNHPVREVETGKVMMTAQNHNYAVEEASVPREIEISYRNLSDGTVEGLSLRRLGVETLQFHPEAAPGPHDARGIFDRFIERCRVFRDSGRLG